jgi:hypothetical protein
MKKKYLYKLMKEEGYELAGIPVEDQIQAIKTLFEHLHPELPKGYGVCFICWKDSERIQYHHYDYKADLTIPLCPSCHRILHMDVLPKLFWKKKCSQKIDPYSITPDELKELIGDGGVHNGGV